MDSIFVSKLHTNINTHNINKGETLIPVIGKRYTLLQHSTKQQHQLLYSI